MLSERNRTVPSTNAKFTPPTCLLRKPRINGQHERSPGLAAPLESMQKPLVRQSQLSCTPALAQSPSLDHAGLLPSSGDASPISSVWLVPSVTSLSLTPPRKYVVRQKMPKQSTRL